MMAPLHPADLLAASFPALASVHKQLSCLAAFTRAAVTGEDLPLLRRYFTVADQLLQLNEASLTAAVENSYRYCLHLDGTTHGNQLARQLMPARLYEAFAHQQHVMPP